jgi:class 3 adenylate cyclase/tetratricopeptide (TPR) repeat protein
VPPTVTASYLFCDLVDSTRFAASVGEELADELRHEHFSALREAVVATGGREVKNTGDGLMVVFSSAVNALRCGVRMQRGIAQCSARTGYPIALRAGASIGEAEQTDDDDYYGLPVIEAARLCAAADADQILISEVLRTIVGSRGRISENAPVANERFELVPLRAMRLKGFDEAIRVFEVVWQRAAAPLFPSTLERAAARPFVGRVGELDGLVAATLAAGKGDGELVLVHGEPGIGKTRLVAEAARQMHAQGGVVLYGRCSEEPLLPYEPFVAALRDYAASCDDAALREHVRFGTASLLRLMPELRARLPAAGDEDELRPDAQSEVFVLFEAIGQWLDSLRGAPGMLVLDDLHWADASTTQLLGFLARRPRGPRVLILGTYRDTDLSAADPLAALIGSLRRDRLVQQVALTGLEFNDVRALIEGIGGGIPDPALTQRLGDETEGNPFFIGELFVHLADTGAVENVGGALSLTRSLASAGIPQGIHDVVSQRLVRLREAADLVLATAAVCGREFEIDVVSRVSGVELSSALSAIDAAIKSHLVLEDPAKIGRFQFAHSLVRQTLYEELSATRRAMLHELVATALRELRADDLDAYVGAIGYHTLEAAALVGVTRAIDAARAAAMQSADHLSYEEAISWCDKVIDVVIELAGGDNPKLSGVLLDRGELHVHLGNAQAATDDASRAAAMARQAHDGEALGRAVALLQLSSPSSAFRVGRGSTDLIPLCRDALEMLPDDSVVMRVRVLSSLALELDQAGDSAGYESTLREVWGLACASEEPAAVSTAGVVYSDYLLTHGDPEKAASVSREAVDASRVARDGDHLLLTLGLLCNHALTAGNVDEYRERRTEHAALAERVRSRPHIWASRVMTAGDLLIAGRLDQAEDAIAHALASAPNPSEPWVLFQYGMQLASLRIEQGRPGEVEALLRLAMDQFPGFTAWRAALAYCLRDQGNTTAAREELQTIVASWQRETPSPVGLALSVALLTDVASEIDDRGCVELFENLLRTRGERYLVLGIVVDSWGSVARTAGILAMLADRLNESERLLETALDQNQRLGSPRWMANTQYDLARLLLRRNRAVDVQRATDLATQARATANRLGLARTHRLLSTLPV